MSKFLTKNCYRNFESISMFACLFYSCFSKQKPHKKYRWSLCMSTVRGKSRITLWLKREGKNPKLEKLNYNIDLHTFAFAFLPFFLNWKFLVPEWLLPTERTWILFLNKHEGNNERTGIQEAEQRSISPLTGSPEAGIVFLFVFIDLPLATTEISAICYQSYAQQSSLPRKTTVNVLAFL